jgi:hypothetical protein
MLRTAAGLATAAALAAAAPALAAAEAPYQDLRSADARDAAHRVIVGSGRVEPARVLVREASGFDWGDAALGAGAALGVVMLAGGTVALVRRHDPGVRAA